MPALSYKIVPERVREWWLSRVRQGLRLLISPVEYRHLRGFAVTRAIGACVATTAGFICLAYAAYGWAAFFLVVGSLNIATALWGRSIARSEFTRG